MRLSLFALKQCIMKQLLDSVFVISEIIKFLVSVISLSLRLQLITLTSTLSIPGITKKPHPIIVLISDSLKKADEPYHLLILSLVRNSEIDKQM